MAIDQVQNSAYFSAVAAANASATKNLKKEKNQTSSVKGGFFSLFKEKIGESAAETSNISATLATEIAGLSEEEAFIHLKDAVDEAGDKLKNLGSADSFEKYKTAVSNFLQYVVAKNYSVDTVNGRRRANGRRAQWTIINPVDEKRDKLVSEMMEDIAPEKIIQSINKKIDQLGSDLLFNKLKKNQLALRVDEIKGILVDFIS